MAFNLTRYLLDTRDAAAEALAAAGRPVGRTVLAPGTSVAWDDCCAGGGQVHTRVVSLVPSTGPGAAFPRADGRQACGVVELAATVALGVTRCAHTVNSNGVAPTAEQVTADAVQSLADAELLLDIIEVSADHVCAQQIVVGTWSPLGVRGGCAGGEWQYQVALSVFDRAV